MSNGDDSYIGIQLIPERGLDRGVSFMIFINTFSARTNW